MIAAGFVMLLVSAVVSISGITLWHFWVGLALLGVGWNFGFIGATALVTQTHRPEERNRVQSFNDFLIFGSMAIGSFGSGKVLAVFGWAAVNEIVFPVVLTAAAMLLWLAHARAAQVRLRPAAPRERLARRRVPSHALAAAGPFERAQPCASSPVSPCWPP